MFTDYAADEFNKNIQKLSPFFINSSYRYARALLTELLICHWEQRKEQFPTFAMVLETKLQQTKIISHSMLPVVIITTHPYDYDSRDRTKHSDIKARKIRLLLTIEHHSRPVESSSSNQGVLGKNVVKDTSWKNSSWKRETKALQRK